MLRSWEYCQKKYGLGNFTTFISLTVNLAKQGQKLGLFCCADCAAMDNDIGLKSEAEKGTESL